MAIRQIKSGKAAGPDIIPAEALKENVTATAKILNILFSKFWDEEQVPIDCKKDFWSRYQRKAISSSATTTGVSLFSQYQEKSSTEYC
ncbi:unnamed protein product [Schistosoma rodhaini]|uniref:Reverse transcriptase domain-containing protein n=1 Tax=Schistosoma rodhaini TaxID=6188 RepID=A0AA85GF80_9TREM|nr:unnamed protein product [Schistosoma rodhaini]